jgi:hypothetical protein
MRVAFLLRVCALALLLACLALAACSFAPAPT